MGLNDSKVYICPYCASEVPRPPAPNRKAKTSNKSLISNESDFCSSEDEKSIVSSSNLIDLPPYTLLCRRCHALYKEKARKTRSSDSCCINTCDKRYIEHLHIAPFIDTIEFDDHKQMDSEHIIKTYLKPYFSSHSNVLIRCGHRLMVKDVEFKVLGCYPPKGYIDCNGLTQFHLNGNDGELIKLKYESIKKIHCLPIQSSLDTSLKIYNIYQEQDDDNSNQTILKISLKPYLKGNDDVYYIKGNDEYIGAKKRHLIEEETFVSTGIQWRVMKCIPFNGYIDAETEIFCHGLPLKDAQKISLRPIYESIPNAHRNFTPKQIKTHYLDPYFRGNTKYIGHSREVYIFGVQFAVRESVPAEGVVMMTTDIDYMGYSIKSKELATMQEMEDMEMAQKLQKEMEEKTARERAMRRRELRGTLRGRWDDPLGFDLGFEFPWNQEEQKPKKRGVDMDIVDRLPTFTFLNNHKNREDQCRICLEYYIDGDDLRILPCFHIYHKECVDTWLTKMSPKCPICNTSIIRQRTRPQR